MQIQEEGRFVAAALKGIMEPEEWATASFPDALNISAAFNLVVCKECHLQQSFVTYLVSLGFHCMWDVWLL